MKYSAQLADCESFPQVSLSHSLDFLLWVCAICLSVFLSVCVSVFSTSQFHYAYVSLSLSFWICVGLFVFRSVFVHPSVRLPVCLAFPHVCVLFCCLSGSLSVSLPFCSPLSLCLPLCSSLSVFLPLCSPLPLCLYLSVPLCLCISTSLFPSVSVSLPFCSLLPLCL